MLSTRLFNLRKSCSVPNYCRRIQQQEPFQFQPEPPKKSGKTGLLWKLLAVTAVTTLVAYIIFKQDKLNKSRRDNRLRSAGTAQIGGNWSMVDHQGHPVSRASYQGKYLLYYFGFTFCPDICPEELRKMKIVIKKLDDNFGEIIQPVFVSLDPWRDSVEQVESYIKQFGPRMVGLTGTPQQCEVMAHNFRVYSASDRSAHLSSDSDYIVDHSIFMYLMDTKGTFVEFYSVDKDPEYIVDNIVTHLTAREEINPGIIWKIKDFLKS